MTTTAFFPPTVSVRLRALSAMALATALAACADSASLPTAATPLPNTSLAATSKGGDAGTVAGGVFDGLWIQTPPVHTTTAAGGSQDLWTQFRLQQKGTVISGEARRFLSTFDANGTPLIVALDLGSPGKVTGSATATGLTLAVTRFAETKINFTLTLALSADAQRLTVAGPVTNPIGITALSR